MRALQELYAETEASHSNLLESSRIAEEKIDELLSKNKMLEQKLESLEYSMVDEGIKVS